MKVCPKYGEVIYKGNENGINMVVLFEDDSMMVHDVEGILASVNSKTRVAAVHIYKENTWPIEAEKVKNTMEELRDLFPDTIFVSVARCHDEDSNPIVDGVTNDAMIQTGASFVDFNMYTCYENGESIIYAAPEAIQIYEKLLELYGSTAFKNDAGKLPLVQKILDELRLLK